MGECDISAVRHDLPPLTPPFKRNSGKYFKEPGFPPSTRKRGREDDVISSDPPLFSSDDLPEAAENYASERSKRLRQGPWWDRSIDQTEAPSSRVQRRRRKKKREFTRNLDSGVFMGSEGTEVSDEEELAETAGQVDRAESPIDDHMEALPSIHLVQGLNPPGIMPLQTIPMSVNLPIPETEEPLGSESWDQRGQFIADRAILNCLETGTESVDLSHLGLCSTPSTLVSLKSMTKSPSSQENFAPLTPNIRLFLQKNNLRSISSAAFDIDRLTVLSLRHNKLEYLPPAIGQLKNLEELNLAGNRLKYLPWELLKLVKGKLKRLSVYPNPFIECGEVLQYDRPLYLEDHNPVEWREPLPQEDYQIRGGVTNVPITVRKWKPPFPWEPSCLAKGSISFLSRTGQPARDLSGNLMPACTSPEVALQINDEPTKPINFSSDTRSPSLIELALQRCSESPDLALLGEYLPNDASPDIRQLLENAQQVKDSGGRVCSVCGRKFIVARTEWIEWWDCIPPSNPQMIPARQGTVAILPLLRQGCSWICTAQEMP